MNGDYVIVTPAFAITEYKLHDTELLIFSAIFTEELITDNTAKTKEEYAELCQVSLKRVNQALKELMNKGYISLKATVINNTILKGYELDKEVKNKNIYKIIENLVSPKEIHFLCRNKKRKVPKEKIHSLSLDDDINSIKNKEDILQSVSNKNLDSNTPKNDKSKFQSLDNKNLDSDSLKSDNKDTTTTNTKNKRNIFIPPTVEEVRQYCQEKGYGINAEEFVNFYESKNWYVGKNKMVKWKSAVALWESRKKTEIASAKTGTLADEEDDYPHDLDYIF